MFATLNVTKYQSLKTTPQIYGHSVHYDDLLRNETEENVLTIRC
jgi:hypothetical protein